MQPDVRAARLVDGTAVASAVAGLAAVGLVLADRYGPGTAMLVAAVAAVAVAVLTRSLLGAVLATLAALFLRYLPQMQALPVQPFTIATVAVAVALVVGVATGAVPAPRFGVVEALAAAFLAWTVLSAVTPHELPAVDVVTGGELSVRSLVQIAVLTPLLLLVAGTALSGSARAVRVLPWAVLAFAGYSALVSVLQFTGPASLVWPHYIVESPGWSGTRAVGVLAQPVENGLLLVAGLVVATHLATRAGASPRERWTAAAAAGPCLVAAYLTHTRGVYLALAVVLFAGLVAVPRMRRILAVGLVVAIGYVALTWTTFTSDDRGSGGVASTTEIDDRLNIGTTAVWAIGQEPVAGWGIGRFGEVNTVHHQQFSADVEWRRGYGFAAHETELAIGAELGLVGMALWVGLMGRIGWELVRRRARGDGELAEVALLVLVAWVVLGLTVDLRFFGFGGALVMLLLGVGIGVRGRA